MHQWDGFQRYWALPIEKIARGIHKSTDWHTNGYRLIVSLLYIQKGPTVALLTTNLICYSWLQFIIIKYKTTKSTFANTLISWELSSFFLLNFQSIETIGKIMGVSMPLSSSSNYIGWTWRSTSSSGKFRHERTSRLLKLMASTSNWHLEILTVTWLLHMHQTCVQFLLILRVSSSIVPDN